MKVIIAGGGIAGLSIAYLSRNKNIDYVVLEKENSPGGLCRSVYKDNFIFDYTGHLLHFQYPEIEKLIKDLKITLLKHTRKSFILFENHMIPYPFQSHLFMLPRDEAYECLFTFINRDKKIIFNNTEEYFISKFGSGIYKHFLYPYNYKLWTLKPGDLSTDWIGRFVPDISLEEVLKPFFTKKEIHNKGYNQVFYYPEGGISVLVKKFTDRIKNLRLNYEIVNVNWTDKILTTKKNEYKYDKLLWSLPLKDFNKLAYPSLTGNLNRSFNNLQAANVLDIEIGFKGDPPDYHWVYLPEKKYIPYRVGCSSNFYNLRSKGKFSIYAEISYSRYRKLPNINRKTLFDEVISQLKKTSLIDKRSKVLTHMIREIKPAYVIYDKHWKRSRKNIFIFFGNNSIIPTGRYGKWYYASIEDVIYNNKKIIEYLK